MVRDRQSTAAFLLSVFLLGGALCPCRGVAAAIGRYLEERASDTAHSPCGCCHQEENPDGSEHSPPQDCECLSGCCDAYLPPSVDSVENLPATVFFPPAFVSGTDRLHALDAPDRPTEALCFHLPEVALQAELCSFRI